MATRKRVTPATVCSYLRQELKRLPYKLHLAPDLSEDYESIRLQFSKHSRRELRNNSMYLRQIIFSDECPFSVSRRANKQNCRICGTALLRKMYQVSRDYSAITVWCANKTVIGNPNKLMLRFYLMPKLRDYPDNTIFSSMEHLCTTLERQENILLRNSQENGWDWVTQFHRRLSLRI